MIKKINMRGSLNKCKDKDNCWRDKDSSSNKKEYYYNLENRLKIKRESNQRKFIVDLNTSNVQVKT